jgi:hypothetical protein
MAANQARGAVLRRLGCTGGHRGGALGRFRVEENEEELKLTCGGVKS